MPRKGLYDKDIIEIVNTIGSMSIRQCEELFYGNYVLAARRLKALETKGWLSSYWDRRLGLKHYVPSGEKAISEHGLIINDFLYKMILNGFEVEGFSKGCKFLNDTLRPDLYVRYRIKNGDKIYTLFLEVDYTHPSDDKRLKKYEKLFDRCRIEGINEFYLIIAKAVKVNLKSNEILIRETDLDFNNFKELIIY